MSEKRSGAAGHPRCPRSMICALAIMATAVAHACTRAGTDEAPDEAVLELPRSTAPVDDSTWTADDEIWSILADEPRTHLRLASAALDRSERETAAQDLEKSASLFRLAARRTRDIQVRGKVEASAVELENLAVDVKDGIAPSQPELDQVYARCYLALAMLQTNLAATAFENGGLEGAGFHIREAVVDLERGFMQSGIPFPEDPRALADITSVGERLTEGRQVMERATHSALDALAAEDRRLDNALGGRRR